MSRYAWGRPALLALLALSNCRPAAPSAQPAPSGGGGAQGPAAEGYRPVPIEARDSYRLALPPVPAVEGPLQISVVYPAATDLVDARDSSFLFGSVGTGKATLVINGQPVRVWPNGAWLAWLPVPADSVLDFHLIARTAIDSAVLDYPVRRVRRFLPPARPVWIDTLSFAPSARAWWPAEEYLPVSVRAAEGSAVRLRLPGGAVVPLVAERAPEDVPWGVRAFDGDTSNLATPVRAERFTGALRGVTLGGVAGPMVGPGSGDRAAGSGCCRRLDPAPITVEAIRGADTARAAWPLQLDLLDSVPLVVEFNDDTAGRGDTDSLTVGRARPGATYAWFFPTGTRTVATGRLGDDVRVRLSRGQDAWVPAADVIPLPRGTPFTRATVGSVTLTPRVDRLQLRIPLSQRVPFRVEEEEQRLRVRFYSAVGDVNWMRYGPADPYLSRLSWQQAASDEVTIDLDLAAPVWGYRARWSRNDLVLEVRRPPRIDPGHPLRGRFIVVDPGHPPAGAMGPTGLREAEANLAVALRLKAMLEEGGATVLMTRTSDVPLDLLPRVKLADSVGADILVSIHNNALPDGVNPYTNNGSSVYYNHPRSIPLAQAIEAELVTRLGLRDLGTGRGDLALVRPTWMPAVLTEGLFMMLPDQESALRQPAGQQRYAEAVAAGIVTFLRGVATGQGMRVH
jgi:N-acetylmuramoyl-L-alanine amidase